jgi:hypothetical protein
MPLIGKSGERRFQWHEPCGTSRLGSTCSKGIKVGVNSNRPTSSVQESQLCPRTLLADTGLEGVGRRERRAAVTAGMDAAKLPGRARLVQTDCEGCGGAGAPSRPSLDGVEQGQRGAILT